VTLSDTELDRYARHIILKEIGGAGQARLLAAHVVLVGMGGIGCPAASYLAAAGIGRLTIIDDDRVELSNLQRQPLFHAGQIGMPKVEAARTALALVNSGTEVEAREVRIGASNAKALVAGCDAVVDGSDNFETRLTVADSALALRIPLVAASVAGFEGQIGVFRGWESDKPCYRCFAGADPERPERSCAEQGVLGAMAGVMGSLAAMEAIRCVTGFGDDSAGKLLIADALALRFRTVGLPKDPGCPACGG
jgi:molybdopterin/thiamine biosynthesis adenylyltransferase